MSNNNIASCLCGGVKIEIKELNHQFTVCHCLTCRKWGGGPFFAVACGADVKFEGGENIKEFESSAWANRGFCQQCGTHLYYTMKESQSYNVPLGLFPQGLFPTGEDWLMSMQYFSDERPSYYCFSNQTKELTGAEIKAYFASQV